MRWHWPRSSRTSSGGRWAATGGGRSVRGAGTGAARGAGGRTGDRDAAGAGGAGRGGRGTVSGRSAPRPLAVAGRGGRTGGCAVRRAEGTVPVGGTGTRVSGKPPGRGGPCSDRCGRPLRRHRRSSGGSGTRAGGGPHPAGTGPFRGRRRAPGSGGFPQHPRQPPRGRRRPRGRPRSGAGSRAHLP